MRALLDTSVLIGADDPGALEGAISAASLAELHFGVLVAPGDDERARRALRLGVIESTFEVGAASAARCAWIAGSSTPARPVVGPGSTTRP